MSILEKVARQHLRAAISRTIIPGGVIGIEFRGQRYIVSEGRFTYRDDAADVQRDTVFDLASLTKVVTTTTAILQLIEERLVGLDSAAYNYLPTLDRDATSQITIRHLLTHTAGYPDRPRLFEHCKDRDALILAIERLDPFYEPGSKRVYDDFGYILLGRIVEIVSGKPFDRYCNEKIFEPLGMDNTMFVPSNHRRSKIAPTEISFGADEPLQGVVHDEHARLLGGVAGHAGLFSSALDLLRFSRMMLGCSQPILRESFIQLLFEPNFTDANGEYGIGWDIRDNRYMPDGIQTRSIGHTGFTGTSIVVDRMRDLAIVFLSNRVFPHRGDAGPINVVRAELHGDVFAAVDHLIANGK